jgi:segregation and condensation protein B
VNAMPAPKLKLAHPLPEPEEPQFEHQESAAPVADNSEALRMLEALLFAAAEPLDEKTIAGRLPEGTDVTALVEQIKEIYSTRGVNVVKVAGKWALRTATDLGHLLAKDAAEPKKLSRAAIETLAIISYHQPVTRAEIEAIRGVTISRGTLDVLMETGWVRLRGRRRVPGRPVTYGTTEDFLIHFGLDSIDDLPGLEELKGAGFLEGRLPSGFAVPMPSDDPQLRDDEDPLDGEDLDLALAPTPEREEESDEAEPGSRHKE